MTGKTHAMVGANAIWIAALGPVINHQTILLGIVGALAGLLPDIDAANAKIHHVAGGSFGALRNLGKHRGVFHSLTAILLVLIMTLIFLSQLNPLLPLAFTVGYASHIFIDALNKPGVQFLFPHKKRYRLLPWKVAPNVGGQFDHALFIIASLLLVFFIVKYDLLTLSFQ